MLLSAKCETKVIQARRDVVASYVVEVARKVVVIGRRDTVVDAHVAHLTASLTASSDEGLSNLASHLWKAASSKPHPPRGTKKTTTPLFPGYAFINVSLAAYVQAVKVQQLLTKSL